MPLFEADLIGVLADGQEAWLDIENARLVTAGREYELGRLPAFVKQIRDEGGIVAFFQRYGRFPGEMQDAPVGENHV